MEQHLLYFLNQRYGLKRLVVMNASAYIKAVNTFSPADNSVAVFGKILRNEIDEEFRFVQQELRDSTEICLRVHLKGKNPLKSDDAISRMTTGVVNGLIGREQWSDVVGCLYNEEDAAVLGNLVKDVSKKYNGVKQRQASNRITPKGTPRRRKASVDANQAIAKLPYASFVKVLLDFQLLSHDKFLSKFRDLFGRLDDNKDGILNEAQFRELCLLVGRPTGGNKKTKERTEEEMQKLLETADPFNNDAITFSDAVACLSNDICELK